MIPHEQGEGTGQGACRELVPLDNQGLHVMRYRVADLELHRAYLVDACLDSCLDSCWEYRQVVPQGRQGFGQEGMLDSFRGGSLRGDVPQEKQDFGQGDRQSSVDLGWAT